MTDRELLELAAKAAGLKLYEHVPGLIVTGSPETKDVDYERWNPLTDDGDALRLAVDLGLNVIQQHTIRGPELVAAACGFGSDDYRETSTLYQGDPRAATRRAITRAAAEIGRAIP